MERDQSLTALCYGEGEGAGLTYKSIVKTVSTDVKLNYNAYKKCHYINWMTWPIQFKKNKKKTSMFECVNSFVMTMASAHYHF